MFLGTGCPKTSTRDILRTSAAIAALGIIASGSVGSASAETVTVTVTGTVATDLEPYSYFSPLFGVNNLTGLDYTEVSSYDTKTAISSIASSCIGNVCTPGYAISSGTLVGANSPAGSNVLTINNHTVPLSSGQFDSLFLFPSMRTVSVDYNGGPGLDSGEQNFISNSATPPTPNIPFGSSTASASSYGSYNIGYGGSTLNGQLSPKTLDVAVSGAPQINVKLYPQLGAPSNMIATFSPMENGVPVTIAQAASDLGFVGFNWYQQVTEIPVPIPLANDSTFQPTSVPFTDPPPGDWVYNKLAGNELVVNPPFYYNQDQLGISPQLNLSGTSLTFADSPESACGGTSTTGCLAPGQQIEFLTELVGILPGGTGPSLSPTFVPLYGFEWATNYDVNGAGGTFKLSSGSGNDEYGSGGTSVLATNVDFAGLPAAEQKLMISDGAEYTGLYGSSVPESRNWMMVIAGAGFVGYNLRKRRDNRQKRKPV